MTNLDESVLDVNYFGKVLYDFLNHTESKKESYVEVICYSLMDYAIHIEDFDLVEICSSYLELPVKQETVDEELMKLLDKIQSV